MTDVRSTWAAAVRAERARRHLDQTQVAQLAGVHQTTVSLAERGRGSLDVYEAIAKALNISLIGESA